MLNNENRIWAIVPAAGVGRRMEGSRPKQYMLLGDQTVIETTLKVLSDNKQIVFIAVGVSEVDPFYEALPLKHCPKLGFYRGGAERMHTVLNGIRTLQDAHKAKIDDWVLVHDAVRPCLVQADLDALITQCLESGEGGLLGSEMVDTVKRVDRAGKVVATEDRAALWRALTPQMFQLGKLLAALETAAVNEQAFTDEAQAMEAAGESVSVVAGAATNIKITRPGDIARAKLFLGL